MKFTILFLFFTFIQAIIGPKISLFEYVNNTNRHNIQPFSPIVNTIKLAKKYGIEIYSERLLQQKGTRLLGVYRPYTRHIVLYNVPELEYFNELNDETLKHELIHAIQHCNGNREHYVPLTSDIFLIASCIVKKKVNVTFIKSFYSEKDFKIELEAYCFEKLVSYEDINILLNMYC
jgi:hypothetical protein